MDTTLEKSKAKLPHIGSDDSFVTVVKSLAVYFVTEITLPSTFEQLRTTSAGSSIKKLVDHLVSNGMNRAIINALLTLKWHFSSLDPDDRNINETRASACEIVAWRFLSRLSERDAVDFCLYDLPPKSTPSAAASDPEPGTSPNERSSLISKGLGISSRLPAAANRQELKRAISHGFISQPQLKTDDDEEDPTSSFTGLNSLEIAAVADCKRFLSQRVVQRIVTGIWNGDITFWANLSEHTRKRPHFYNKRKSDPFTRLRVPRYVKLFEVLFFASFIALYYGVLLKRKPLHVTVLEGLLFIWFASFAYDEFSEFVDAGSILYAVDLWNGCDLVIILVGMAYFITRIIGLAKDSREITEIAFDILSLEALFMVPRICSLLSLHPYFGTLIPCLKEMTKDFVKFMVIVVVLYLGFLTTFTLLARDTFTSKEMSWIMLKVFFGSSYIGFDIMHQISPLLGPPLMLCFVVLTNFLLLTSMISILSNTFSKIIAHAREEYLYVYSIYVLEASTSNRLTHFYPPLNLIPLVFLRPLRLFTSAEKLRRARILLLKATHTPFVGLIYIFEFFTNPDNAHNKTFSSIGPSYSQPLRMSSTNNTTKKQPFLSKTTKMKADSLHFATAPPTDADASLAPPPGFGILRGPGDSMGADGSADAAVHVSSGSETLEKRVEDLSEKIAQLTALILAEKGIGEDV